MGIVVYYYTYYSLVGSTRAYLPGSGKGSFPEGGFSPRRHHPKQNFFSFSHSTRVMLVRGEWAIKRRGGYWPCLGATATARNCTILRQHIRFG